jgi:hypothetical protein
MPLILIPLLMFALAFVGTFNPVLSIQTENQPSVASEFVSSPEIHYTRTGIVAISRTTGATRFTPYSRSPEIDRRRSFRG